MIKVSVVIPVYNVENYLKECLDSVVNQSLRETEIICVNDASTDKSLEILKEYSYKDKRIKILDLKDNMGLSVVRNKGAKIAQGGYLYFLDSDDVISKNALEELYNKSHEKSLDILFFDWQILADDRNKYKNKECNRTYTYENVYTGKDLFVEMRKNIDYRVLAWSYLLRRKFYEENNLMFIPGILHEDNPFTFQCILLAERASHMPCSFYYWRMRPTSISQNKQRFAVAYGYFKGYLSMLDFVNKKVWNENERYWVEREINRKLFHCKKVFWGLDKKEKEKYKFLDLLEKNLFKQIVVDSVNKNDMMKLKEKNENLKKEMDSLCNGWSYRIGRIITYLPRKLRDFMNND